MSRLRTQLLCSQKVNTPGICSDSINGCRAVYLIRDRLINLYSALYNRRANCLVHRVTSPPAARLYHTDLSDVWRIDRLNLASGSSHRASVTPIAPFTIL